MARYVISAISSPMGEEVGGEFIEKHPENAILEWCKLGQKYPTYTSLQANSEQSAFALLVWAQANFDKLESWFEEFECPYKPEWMRGVIDFYVSKGKSSMQWNYDEISPFCMG